jgi:hypothetical protein
MPAYWHNDGVVGQPARAVRSEVAPDARDLQSNQYRNAENFNLLLNIKQSGPLGKGFGLRINYVSPIVDITNVDPAISFLPHNGLLYIWMRLGILGELLLWLLVAAAIIRASQLARVADREAALFGAVVVCAVIAYVLQGYNDLGFFWFRIALCLGFLLGATEATLYRTTARDTRALVVAVP